MKRFCNRLIALVCAGISLQFTACNAEPEEVVIQSKPVSENIFRMYDTTEADILNYLKTNDENQNNILANTIDCLVEYDSYGNIIPSLAESWTYNSDMTQWTFQIRQGVQWLDYEGNAYAEVTADDWVATAEYICNAENASEWLSMYTSSAGIHNAQEYYDYTDYVIEARNEKKEAVQQKKKQIREKTKQTTKNTTNTTESTESTAQTTTTTTSTTSTTTQDTTQTTTTESIRKYLPRDIGVQATEQHTLVYTLDKPCPFFLNLLSYPAFLPVNRQFLKESGNQFGEDNQNLLYNGAYILSDSQPQEKQILTKNTQYWDIENIHIDRIEYIYHPDTEQIQEHEFLEHDVDTIKIRSDMLDTWMNDAETRDFIHPAQPDNSCSYFYAFNFNPQFGSEYEPENWKLAVNNENFRHAVASAFNRLELLSSYESYKPERFLSNTITPKEFTFAAGTDYTQYDALRTISKIDNYQPSQAQEYRDTAREELTQRGATFPIKMLVPYSADTANQEQEAQLIKKQLEETLGNDFIQVELYADKNTDNRQNGNYAFMKCSKIADYVDPQTWAEPFMAEQDYIFWDLSGYRSTQEIFSEWQTKITEAIAIYGDELRRYTAFAEAEQILIGHAIVIPFSTATNGYVVSRLNPFESEYTPVGIASKKLKFCRLGTTSVSMEEYERLYEQWLSQRRISLK